MNIMHLFKPLWHIYILNYIFSYIPCLELRIVFLKMLGANLGKHTIIDMGFYILSPGTLRIGDFCHLNRNCFLDARGGLLIGNNVSISHNVSICTGGHDFNTPTFDYNASPIVIEDNVWIGLGATILKGVTIREGSVIAAGAIVTKSTDPYGVYAGVPAKKIEERKREINYHCTDFAYYKNIRKPYFK